MATTTLSVWKVFAGCQKQLLRPGGSAPFCVSLMGQRNPPVRMYAVAKAQKKSKKEDAENKPKKEKRIIDDTGRHKPFGKTAWVPVDDVYILRYYPRTIHSPADAIEKLKQYQKWDFTPPDQPVYIDLKLDMKLEKKKKVDPFVSTVHLPHPFKTEMNKVVVFTEDSLQAQAARENGAVFAGGVELIEPILNDDVSADFYIAVPDILSKLLPLKNKLRKKFPKTTRGSVSFDIPKLLDIFKVGHEYIVEKDCYIRTQIATLNMPNQHIFANLMTIIKDVCSHRPANMGPFIERAIISSQTSEAVWFRSQDALPQPELKGEK